MYNSGKIHTEKNQLCLSMILVVHILRLNISNLGRFIKLSIFYITI